MPSGSSRLARQRHDFREVSSVITNLEKDSDHTSSIRDCRRVGKYDSGRSRPRPVLVLLNSTADVHNILSRRHHLTSPILIKPDLSPADRKVEALLLKERWRLIKLGNDCRCIKIRGPSIYLNGQLHGQVTESGFSPTLKPGDSELQPSSPTHCDVPNVSLSQSPACPTNTEKGVLSDYQALSRCFCGIVVVWSINLLVFNALFILLPTLFLPLLKHGLPLPSLMVKYCLLGTRFIDGIDFLVVAVSCWLSTTLSLLASSIPPLI